MGVQNRYDLYDVELGVNAAPVRLPGIMNAQVPLGTEHRTERSSGALYPQHTAIFAQNPQPTFRSTAVAKCWAEIGLGGFNLADLNDATFPGLSIFAYRHAQGGGRAGTGNHRKYNFQTGMVIPTRITCDHQADAELEYGVFPTWDGNNDIMQLTDATDVPDAGDDDERFTIGKVTIGGMEIEGIRNLELELGNAGETESSDSDIWPTHASIVNTSPVLTLRGIDPHWLDNNIALLGSLATHGDTTIYLRKREAGQGTPPGYEPDADTEHIAITMDGLAFIDDAYSGDLQSPVGSSLVLASRYDGTNAPVVVTLNSTIT